MSVARNPSLVLKDVTHRYQEALRRYEQAMARGDRDGADDALGDMQDIERSTTIIQHGAKT